MPISRHEEEVEYLRRLGMSVPRVEELVGLDQGFDQAFCCLSRPYDCFYVKRDAADWWHKLSFECWQQTSVRGHQFVSWHNLEVFGLPQSKRKVYYARVLDEWTRWKAARVLVVLTPVTYTYLTKFCAGGYSA